MFCFLLVGVAESPVPVGLKFPRVLPARSVDQIMTRSTDEEELPTVFAPARLVIVFTAESMDARVGLPASTTVNTTPLHDKTYPYLTFSTLPICNMFDVQLFFESLINIH